MQIKAKLHGGAYPPVRKHDTDAGADLRTPKSFAVRPGGFTEVDFGISMAIPEGFAGFIFARSGLGSNDGITPRNCVGVIDSDYRGTIKCVFKNDSDVTYIAQTADRVAQIVIMPVVCASFFIVEELDETERGDGGFGHTGR